MISERAREAIERADTDALLRIVDGHCENRAWEALLELRTHCRAAVDRGKQLWGVDEHIRYRLALEAPGPHAGPAVSEGPTRFTLGPLPEVAAVRHTWADLEPYLDPGPERAMFAHERVVRGEDLTGADVDTAVLEMPLALCEWEPGYPLAEYGSDRVDAPTPAVPGLTESPTRKAPRVDEPFTIDALAALVAPWVEQSNGRADVVAVKGDASAAIGTLGAVQAYLAPVDTRSAFSWMAWAAASGGAHGRRSGMAAGRFGAWWAGAALAGVEWPPDPAELGVGVDELDWWLWSDGAATGWSLRLAVEDTGSGLAWAIGAVDEE